MTPIIAVSLGLVSFGIAGIGLHFFEKKIEKIRQRRSLLGATSRKHVTPKFTEQERDN